MWDVRRFDSSPAAPCVATLSHFGRGVVSVCMIQPSQRISWAALGCLLLALVAHPAGAFTQRVANTSLNLPQVPVTESSDFSLVDAFPGLTFTRPVGMAVPPGETNRLFVIEQRGVISVIPDLRAPSRETFLDLEALVDDSNNEEGLLGLAFHPGYAANGLFYVFYTAHIGSACPGDDNINTLSRFSVSSTNINRAEISSEAYLLRQCDDAWNHNAGDLHFGDDGYLYVALGDEGGGNDSWDNSQRIDKDFFSAIARIDVDRLPGNLEPNPHPAVALDTNGVARYKVPVDNPYAFLGPDIRSEFFAYGLRNPWRFSIDRPTGRIYCGDVGQNAWEEVNLIESGGNYGWRLREGFVATPSGGVGGAKPPDNVDPILVYPHDGSLFGGYSITGGFVYRGARFPDLVGHYIFADYVSGRFWSVLYDGTNATQWTHLVTDNGAAGFLPDPRNGDVLVCDRDAGRVKRLLGSVTSNIPQDLAAAGVFADLENLVPHAGIEPYDLNVPFWSDGAIKSRWFSVPDTNDTMVFHPEGNWTFPTGAVWVKHFELELTNGVPASRKRLETRVLVKTDDGSYGLTYRWGDATTNATLVPSIGLDESFTLVNGGVVSTQVWHYPSQAECLQCHTPAAGHILGFRTEQLNRDLDYGDGVKNQLRALEDAGYLANEVPPPGSLRALASADDETAGLGYRVRSFLQANCANCHIPGAPSQGQWIADLYTPLDLAGIVEGGLVNNQGNVTNRVIRRGDPDHSMILTRLAQRGPGQMPPIASNVVDTQAVALVTAWIDSLAGFQTLDEWQVAYWGATNHPDAALTADPDEDGGDNRYERLTRTSPTNTFDVYTIQGLSPSNGAVVLEYDELADVGFSWQTTADLPGGDWTFLEVPGHRVWFPAANQAVALEVPVTNRPHAAFRLRLHEL